MQPTMSNEAPVGWLRGHATIYAHVPPATINTSPLLSRTQHKPLASRCFNLCTVFCGAERSERPILVALVPMDASFVIRTIKKRLRRFEIGRREALSETTIDRCEKRVRGFGPAPVLPKPGKARCGP